MPPIRPLTSALMRTLSSAARGSVHPRQWPVHQAAKGFLIASPRTRDTTGQQVRWQSQTSSASAKESKVYEFRDVRKLIETSPHRLTVLIDTREPAELSATGRIPSALNIPITSSPDAFFLSEEEFEDRFGFARPSKETEVVFYCKAGVRSRAAARLASQAGWEKVGEYAGSWVDWEGRGGDVQR